MTVHMHQTAERISDVIREDGLRLSLRPTTRPRRYDGLG